MRFDVRRLDQNDAVSTYALARLGDPGLSLEAWKGQLDRPADEAGVFAAFDRTSARALLSYVDARTAEGEALLVIRWLAAFDLLNPDRVARDLMAGVRRLHCSKGRRMAWSPADLHAPILERAVAETAALHSVL